MASGLCGPHMGSHDSGAWHSRIEVYRPALRSDPIGIARRWLMALAGGLPTHQHNSTADLDWDDGRDNVGYCPRRMRCRDLDYEVVHEESRRSDGRDELSSDGLSSDALSSDGRHCACACKRHGRHNKQSSPRSPCTRRLRHVLFCIGPRRPIEFCRLH